LIDCLVHLLAPVFLMKQVEDPIKVLRAIALLEKEATLGSHCGTKRSHDALGQVDKTGEASWFRDASSAKKDDVASIALLQKLDWDTGTIREKRIALQPRRRFMQPSSTEAS
jgi:hypothetical protein